MADGAAESPLRGVLADAWMIARHRPRLIAAVILIPSLIFGLLDSQLQPDDWIGAVWLFGLVMIYLELLVFSAALHRFDLLPGHRDHRRLALGRYPAAFGLTLLYMAGLLAGLLALIVPGLVLMVRWTVAIPVLLGEGESIVGSLKRSWSLTRGNAALIVEIHILFLLWAAIWGLVAELWYPESGPAPLAAAFSVNLLFTVAQVALWLVSAALYRHLREQELAADPGDYFQPRRI